MGKRYSGVEQFVRDMRDDAPEFAEGMLRQPKEHQLVHKLFALRCAKGLTQGDIAKRLECSQSRVSKLEDSSDGDLRLEDIVGYACALGYSVEIALVPSSATMVDRVKHHAWCIKRLLDQLAATAKDDHSVGNGLLGFFGEAAWNLLKIVKDAATIVQAQLTKRAQERIPAFAIEVCEDQCGDPDNQTAICAV
jgi:transcriptional regulator with XRE-family HTH domain